MYIGDHIYSDTQLVLVKSSKRFVLKQDSQRFLVRFGCDDAKPASIAYDPQAWALSVERRAERIDNACLCLGTGSLRSLRNVAKSILQWQTCLIMRLAGLLRELKDVGLRVMCKAMSSDDYLYHFIYSNIII